MSTARPRLAKALAAIPTPRPLTRRSAIWGTSNESAHRIRARSWGFSPPERSSDVCGTTSGSVVKASTRATLSFASDRCKHRDLLKRASREDPASSARISSRRRTSLPSPSLSSHHSIPAGSTFHRVSSDRVAGACIHLASFQQPRSALSNSSLSSVHAIDHQR